jgi:hypothetical protein
MTKVHWRDRFLDRANKAMSEAWHDDPPRPGPLWARMVWAMRRWVAKDYFK